MVGQSPMALAPSTPSFSNGNTSVNPIVGETNALIGSMQVTAHQNDQAQKARDLALKRQQATLLSSLPPSQMNPSAVSSASLPKPPQASALPFTTGSSTSPASTPPMPAVSSNPVDAIKSMVSNAWTQASQLIASGVQNVAQVVTGAPAQAGTLPPNAVATASPLPTMMNGSPNGGGLIHPLAGKGQISSPFGPRGGRNHNGIDLAAAQGTPVVAAQGGTVTVNDFDANGYGNWVAIRHPDGSETRYGHLVGKSPIAEGTQVTQGQVIGQVGSTGRSTGPHLHYEVRIGGKPKDPMAFLPKGDTQKA